MSGQRHSGRTFRTLTDVIRKGSMGHDVIMVVHPENWCSELRRRAADMIRAYSPDILDVQLSQQNLLRFKDNKNTIKFMGVKEYKQMPKCRADVFIDHHAEHEMMERRLVAILNNVNKKGA